MGRRRSTREVVTIYWRDIPAQVNGTDEHGRHQILLPDKFQRAIDRAKRKAKIYTADEDVAQWRRTSQRVDGGDVAAAAQAAADRLVSEFSSEALGMLAYVGGWCRDLPPTDEPSGSERATTNGLRGRGTHQEGQRA